MAQISAEFALNLPGYEIVRELGRGGVSTVYLARHRLLDRRVALKVMSPALAVEEGFNKRFIREGQTIAQLEHPGIVTVYDVAVVDHRPYIAMEYLAGGSLKDRMKGPMSPGDAITLLRSIADSLGCAHASGVYHRDVKPENILFRENDDPVLTDFGIAKWDSQDTSLTSVGIVVGTPRYISPEQAQGQGSDARSDIYALGVILYEMLTGRPPYDVKGSMSLLYAHINDPIPRLPEGLSEYQKLIDELMAKDPEMRVPDCRSLALRLDRFEEAALENGLEDTTYLSIDQPVVRGRHPRGRLRWPVVVLVGLVLPVLALVLWLQGYRFTLPPAGQQADGFRKMVSHLIASDNEQPESVQVADQPIQPPSPAQPVPQPGHDLSGGTEIVTAERQTPAAAGGGDEENAGSRIPAASGESAGVPRTSVPKSWDYKNAPADEAAKMDSTVRRYQEAAEQGRAPSQFYLGVAYGNGDGVARNDERALYWLTRASDAGIRDAKYNLVLARIFSSKRDTHAAAKLALELADQKYAPAYRVLGWMYNTGTGVDSSFVQSVRWNMRTVVGDVTGTAGPPGRVVRRWERQLEIELSKIKDPNPPEPSPLVK